MNNTVPTAYVQIFRNGQHYDSFENKDPIISYYRFRSKARFSVKVQYTWGDVPIESRDYSISLYASKKVQIRDENNHTNQLDSSQI